MTNRIVKVDAREKPRIETVKRIFDEMGGGYDFEVELLPVGDYVCDHVAVEFKFKDIIDVAHLYSQCRSLTLAFHDHSHVVVAMSLPAAVKHAQHTRPGLARSVIYGLVASIEDELGVHVDFAGTEEHAFRLIYKLFEKGNQQEREVALPVAKRHNQNKTVQLYMSFDGVGEETAWRLYERFKKPSVLFNHIANIHKREDSWFDEQELTWCRSVLTKMSAVVYGRK